MKKKKTKSLAEYKNDVVWPMFSEYIRLKYADAEGYVTCVTCKKKKYWKGDSMQAGHLLDGRSNSILFEEKICFPQCYSCNVCKHGNKEKFVPWFIDKFGRELFDDMERQKAQVKKFTREELEDLFTQHKSKVEELLGKIEE